VAIIVLSYKGVCDGGPWKGQRVEAEFGFVNAPGGVYRWSNDIWQWKSYREMILAKTGD
jgi:hypothetical protein